MLLTGRIPVAETEHSLKPVAAGRRRRKGCQSFGVFVFFKKKISLWGGRIQKSAGAFVGEREGNHERLEPEGGKTKGD